MTYPYLAEQVGPLWVMRDAPRTRKGEDYRNEEWIAHGVDPTEVHKVVRKRTRGRYAICAIYGVKESSEAIRAGDKRLGYRLLTTEPFMLHRLAKIPRFKPPPGISIERVTSQEMADRLAKAARSRQILPEHLVEHAPHRQYVALDDKRSPIGWLRSIVVDQCKATWCSNMHVQEKHRRRGIARAMMARMLKDDRDHGATTSVLLASHTGAMLYPVVGYEQIGELLLYSPTKK
jgi:predicted N-acetyltransferase YhbS